jgi:hypothetical protein
MGCRALFFNPFLIILKKTTTTQCLIALGFCFLAAISIFSLVAELYF